MIKQLIIVYTAVVLIRASPPTHMYITGGYTLGDYGKLELTLNVTDLSSNETLSQMFLTCGTWQFLMRTSQTPQTSVNVMLLSGPETYVLGQGIHTPIDGVSMTNIVGFAVVKSPGVYRFEMTTNKYKEPVNGKLWATLERLP